MELTNDSELQFAKDFAKKKHGDTYAVRKNSLLPYFVHPEMVADLVMAYGGNDIEIEAAYLHDVLEDTNTTAEELEYVFGPDVAQIVEEVTNFQPDVDLYGKETYINLELESLSDSALFVKIADMIANTLDNPKPEQAERIHRNLQHLLDCRDNIPTKCRRLLKAFPLEDFGLDVSECSDAYEDDVYNYQSIVASKERPNKRALKEKALNFYVDKGVSNLTKKHYKIRLDHNYTYGLENVAVVDGSDLRLDFSVSPTFMDGQPVPNKAGRKQNKNIYKVEVLFKGADEFIDFDEVEDLPGAKIKGKLEKVYANCDLQFYSDDPSFYWQGFWEGLDSVDSSIYPFKGTKGKDIWGQRHLDSGGLVDPRYRVTKHITQILNDLDKYTNNIANKLAGGDFDYD